MPVAALENTMVDAIKLELAKIGTAPLSEWLTQSPPTIKEGVPGDRPTGPNQMSVYVQHVGSNPGSDSAGTALHQLECTFVIWCCSSHAADGQRRVLKLLQDVRRALVAAEPTFYAAFPYGSRIGEYSFTGDDARIRAGLSMGALEFRLTGRLELEGDMTEAQTRALIHEMLMSPAYQRFELDRPVGAQGGTNLPGIRTAGFTEKPWGLAHYVSSPAGAANRTVEVCKDWLVNPLEYTGLATFSQRITYAMLMNLVSMGGAAPAGECLQGIQIGSMGVAPPYQTNWVSALLGPCIQFRYNLGRSTGDPPAWSNGWWELMIFADDGQPPLVLDADIHPVTAADKPKEVKLEYLPAPAGGSVVRAYLNGQLAKEYSGERLQALYGRTNTRHYGYFMTSGSDGATSLTEAGFLESRIWLPDAYAYPSPPNP